jgi:hypothetical protein
MNAYDSFISASLTVQVNLGSFNQPSELKKTFAPIFEKMGYECNGYLWARFMHQILAHQAPQVLDQIYLNPSYDHINIDFGHSFDAWRLFKLTLAPVFQNAALLEGYMRTANDDRRREKGRKVQFLASLANSGFPGKGQQRALKYLEDWNTYTIDELKVGPSSVDLFLQEFPRKAFNAAYFHYRHDAGRSRPVV